MYVVVLVPGNPAFLERISLDSNLVATMSRELNNNKPTERLSFSITYGEFIRRYRLLARERNVPVDENTLMFLGPITPEKGLYKYILHFIFFDF